MNFATFRAKLARAHRSLTLWFNGALAAIIVALPVAMDNLPMLAPYVPGNFFKYAMMVTVFGNFLLRFKTSKPLEEK